jgi:hypothetical protein
MHDLVEYQRQHVALAAHMHDEVRHDAANAGERTIEGVIGEEL